MMMWINVDSGNRPMIDLVIFLVKYDILYPDHIFCWWGLNIHSRQLLNRWTEHLHLRYLRCSNGAISGRMLRNQTCQPLLNPVAIVRSVFQRFFRLDVSKLRCTMWLSSPPGSFWGATASGEHREHRKDARDVGMFSGILYGGIVLGIWTRRPTCQGLWEKIGMGVGFT